MPRMPNSKDEARSFVRAFAYSFNVMALPFAGGFCVGAALSFAMSVISSSFVSSSMNETLPSSSN